MKNYWLHKSVEKKIKTFQEERARTLKEVMMQFSQLSPRVEPITTIWRGTPISGEVPQENKMYQKQVYMCRLTGVT